MSGREQEAGARPQGRGPGAGLLAALLGAVGIGPVLIYGLSATSDLVIADLGITEAQFGLFATVCFASAAVGNASLARLSDRLSDRVLMCLIFLLAAAALGLAAVPGGYMLVLVAAGISGLAQSFPNGVTNRILLQRVPARRRIGWAGIKQSGVQASQLTASLAFPAVAVWIGWRGASLLGVLLALGLMALTLHVLRQVPPLAVSPATDRTMDTSPGPGPGPQKESATPMSHPRLPGVVWALTFFGFLNGLGVQATNVYLPLFAVRELEFSLLAGGLTAAAAGAIGVAARVGWGRVMSMGASAPKLLLVLSMMALTGAGTFLAAGITGWAVLLWLAVALHGASALGVSVVIMGALLRSIPAERMASASGIATAGMFAGFTLGPLVMGLLIGATGGFHAGWIAAASTYTGCVVLSGVLVARGRRIRGG
ncbi:MFS transporter [Nesterenkonia sp. HG001]|uniref:MFS transporter n=1 Tax=Nesterenkonia sp. HG001 TaxID=2983207 RepID=UPI002AC3B214|nr:MFS transporter [Nesterenkonia sp. HG001]MDZ5077302.1 MFS transporter [Nesterenkonia sp. HG001]